MLKLTWREKLRSLKWRMQDFVRDVRWYFRAAIDQPSGLLCHWCKRPNFFCDDLGWFAITPDNVNGITCEHCYRGPLGEKHIAKYGVGDR